MKRQLISFLTGLILILCLTQCGNKDAKNLVGVWQLQQMNINGAVLSGKSLGNWLWEFNAVGGYLTDIAGMREKGKYYLKDSVLTLKIMMPKDGPTQVYKIVKLDSMQLDLFYYENRNRSTLHFIKRQVGDVKAEDKD